MKNIVFFLLLSFAAQAQPSTRSNCPQIICCGDTEIYTTLNCVTIRTTCEDQAVEFLELKGCWTSENLFESKSSGKCVVFYENRIELRQLNAKRIQTYYPKIYVE